MKTDTWEKEFDKQFTGELWIGTATDTEENGEQLEDRVLLKSFIRSLLAQQKAELVAEIRKKLNKEISGKEDAVMVAVKIFRVLDSFRGKKG